MRKFFKIKKKKFKKKIVEVAQESYKFHYLKPFLQKKITIL